jgi:hypothetical protein
VILSFCFILIFSGYKEDSENTLTLTFAGDAIPQFMIRNILDNYGESGIIRIFSLVTNYLKDTITFYNLETTISENPAPFKAYTFQVQPDFLLALQKAGFDYYTVANNHSLDYGVDGFQKTMKYIDKSKATGYKCNDELSSLLFEEKGVKLGFFSFSMLSNNPLPKNSSLKGKSNVYLPAVAYDESSLLLIENFTKVLSSQCDILIVGVHWGEEYSFEPTKLQEKTAKRLIQAGADIIWGNHPHVIEPFEIYDSKLILYSCGNLISGQAYNIIDPKDATFHPNYYYTRSVPIIQVEIDTFSKQLKTVGLIPLYQANNYGFKNSGEPYSSLLIPLTEYLNDCNSINSYLKYYETVFDWFSRFLDKKGLAILSDSYQKQVNLFFSKTYQIVLKSKNKIYIALESQNSEVESP